MSTVICPPPISDYWLAVYWLLLAVGLVMGTLRRRG